MPFYSYCCSVCRLNESVYKKIDDRNESVLHCSAPMQRLITAPAILPDIQSYISPASGKVINSRKQRTEDLLREGCIPNEPGLKEHIAARAESEKEKAFKPIADSIDSAVSSLYASGHI
jgi:hypothetical protein